MNEIEKIAMTDESTTPTIDEKSALSESRSITCRSVCVSASESEKVLDGWAKSDCRYSWARDKGSSIDATTVAKSTCANWFSLLKTSGTKSEQSVAKTIQMTTSVQRAASQRGMRQPRISIPVRRLTSGRPMTASTAETRM